MGLTREQMAQRVAAELQDGMAVNLGIGIPTLVANFIPPGLTVWLHSENGLLGMGPFPYEGEEDPQVINAGKQTVTIVPGGSTFDSAMSFGMIRGGHVDIAVLGALEVSEAGDLANWAVPGKRVNGMGGAMDLVSGAKRVITLMTHVGPDGTPKIRKKCSLPLTGVACVDLIVTDMAVLGVTRQGIVLLEIAPDTTVEEVVALTECQLMIPQAPRTIGG